MENDSQHFVGKIAQKGVIEHQGKVLVSLGIGDSVWEFPGGRLHTDEEPQRGFEREVKEELDVNVTVIRPLHVCRSLHRSSNTWRILIAYLCSIEDPERIVKDDNEVAEFKWISREELATLPMFDDCREVADVYLRQ